MITHFHLDHSRSERIVWLLEELGLPDRLETFLRRSGPRRDLSPRWVEAPTRRQGPTRKYRL